MPLLACGPRKPELPLKQPHRWSVRLSQSVQRATPLLEVTILRAWPSQQWTTIEIGLVWRLQRHWVKWGLLQRLETRRFCRGIGEKRSQTRLGLSWPGALLAPIVVLQEGTFFHCRVGCGLWWGTTRGRSIAPQGSSGAGLRQSSWSNPEEEIRGTAFLLDSRARESAGEHCRQLAYRGQVSLRHDYNWAASAGGWCLGFRDCGGQGLCRVRGGHLFCGRAHRQASYSSNLHIWVARSTFGSSTTRRMASDSRSQGAAKWVHQQTYTSGSEGLQVDGSECGVGCLRQGVDGFLAGAVSRRAALYRGVRVRLLLRSFAFRGSGAGSSSCSSFGGCRTGALCLLLSNGTFSRRSSRCTTTGRSSRCWFSRSWRQTHEVGDHHGEASNFGRDDDREEKTPCNQNTRGCKQEGAVLRHEQSGGGKWEFLSDSNSQVQRFEPSQRPAYYVPSPRSRSSSSSSAGQCPGGALGADGEDDGYECEGQEGERSELEPCNGPAFRDGSRGGRRARTGGRRAWIAGSLRSSFSLLGEVDWDCGAPSGREEERVRVETRSGLRCSWRSHDRRYPSWVRQEERLSEEIAENYVCGESDRACAGGGEADVRGPSEPDAGTRASANRAERPSLGGIQVKDRSIQIYSSLSMGYGRDLGQLDRWQCGQSKMHGCTAPTADRSGKHRPWQLVVCFGAELGAIAAICSAGSTRSTQHSVWRAAVLQTFRLEMVRGDAGVPQRSGRLHCQKESNCKAREAERRSRHRGRRLLEEEEGKSKGKGCSSSPGVRCMTADACASASHHGHGTDDVGSSRRFDPPGANASTIKVASFLNSLPRLLMKTRCGLSDFLQSLVMTHELADSSTSSRSSIWPMPVPFPEVFLPGSVRGKGAHLKRLVSMQVAVMDWLVLGMPKFAPRSIKLGKKLSCRQWSVVRMLEFLVVDGNTPEFVDAASMGRAASKVEDFEFHLEALARMVAAVHVGEPHYLGSSLTSSMAFDPWSDEGLRCGIPVGRSSAETLITAKPLVAERLTFPSAPLFEPCEFFDEPTRERYEKPRTLGKSPDEVGDPPRVSVRADKHNKVELYKKLAMSGRLKPLTLGAFSKTYTSGLFSVTKDADRDRLILDGRPANMVDRPQTLWCKAMASSAALAGLHIEDDRVLCASGEDLKDFFYQFVVNEERLHRNVLSDPISVSEAEEIFGGVEDRHIDGDRVWVGLSTLAMGDCCSVEFAQCSHLGLLLQKDVAVVNELLTLYSPPPRGLLQIGIVVDDLVVLEHLLRSDLGQVETEGYKRTSLAKKAYDQVGLQSNSKKAFLDETCSRFWGIELDGDKGLLRCSSLRLWPITVVTIRTCMLGLATVGLLEAIAGSWVSLLGVRRKLFSLLDVVFEPLTIKDQKIVIRLSEEIKSELLAVCVMGSLAVVNLRAGFAPFVCATDASLDWLAAVRAPLPSTITKELSRHTIRKGVWSKLLPPHSAWRRSHGLLPPEEELPEDEPA